MNSFDIDSATREVAKRNARLAAIAARPTSSAEIAVAADWEGRRRKPLPRMSELAAPDADSGFYTRAVLAVVTAFLFGLALAHFAPAPADILSRAAWNVLPDCPTEDSDNCKWNAAERGNGAGESFIAIGGHVWGVRS